MLVLVPLTLIQGHSVSLEWVVRPSAWAVLGISISSTFAYTMFFYTIKISGPVFASQSAYIVTMAGVLWGIVLLGEQHSVWLWISVVVMTSGLVLVTPIPKIYQS
jgi:drug/metabolite transporter (DMT)-like permease